MICSRTDEVSWFLILHGSLCNSSHFNNEGLSVQVNTFPAGICAAEATGLRFHSLPPFFCLSLSLWCPPPSICASSIISLSLPHFSSIYPRDLKFNYCQAAVGGRLSCTGTAERNPDTQHVKQNASWEWLHCRQGYGTGAETRAGEKRCNLFFLITDEAWQEVTRGKHELHVWRTFLTDENVSGDESGKRWSQSCWSKIRHHRTRIKTPLISHCWSGLTC